MKTTNWERDGRSLEFTELGMGTAPLGNMYRAIDEAQAQDALTAAWDAGVRFFDTAPLYGYGLAETRLGHFLRGRPRDDYTLATKVGRYMEPVAPGHRSGVGKWHDVPCRREIFDYTRSGIYRSFDQSMARLGVDRVDIIHCHDLDIFNQGSPEVLEARRGDFLASGINAMVALREEGVVKAIGAGVNEIAAAQYLVERCDLDLVLLAGRYTLLEQEALNEFLPLCEARGVGIVLGGPYNSGILATGPREGAYYNYEPAKPDILERVRRIEAVCERHGTRLIEAALRFPLHHPSVVATVPGGQSGEESRENGRIIAKDIPGALWAELKAEGLLRRDAPTP